MNTTKRMSQKLNEGTHMRLCAIQYAINRIQNKLDIMAHRLETDDGAGQWHCRSKDMGALKRAILDFKHDVKL